MLLCERGLFLGSNVIQQKEAGGGWNKIHVLDLGQLAAGNIRIRGDGTCRWLPYEYGTECAGVGGVVVGDGR